ncbi:hypothetical protein [Streptomyces sp. NPDC127033]|uniref:hypothetical protein n=1 Tax=Streptomyces sp. NPDC127033 TaxID=3347110 RepID=UPI003649FAE5
MAARAGGPFPPTAAAQDPTKCAALRTGWRFERDGYLTMELQVSSATLGIGGRPMMEGLLYHAAHALAQGVIDVSGGDRCWYSKTRSREELAAGSGIKVWDRGRRP